MKTEEVRALMATHNLTFSDCVRAFATDASHPAIAAAREFQEDGNLEFDQSLVVSEGDDPTGDYVMCWKWVEYDKAPK